MNPPINGMDKSAAVEMAGQYESGLVCDMGLRFPLRYKTPAARRGLVGQRPL